MQPTMMTYIEEQPAALEAILGAYPQHLASVEAFARQHPVRRLLVLATGSSLNAAMCARYFFEHRFGLLVDIKEPYNFMHYEAIDPHTDMVLVVSQSGKSASTLAAMEKVQAAGLPVFALTSDLDSPIGRRCDQVLDIHTGIEKVGFVTRGFSATVLNLLLVALTLARAQQQLDERETQDTLAALHQLAAAIPDTIARTEAFFERHLQALQSGTRFIAIGEGALTGVAKEFETKFTETVRVPSGGFELEAYMHGPYLEANAEHVMFFIEDAPNPRLRALRDYMSPAVNQAFLITLTDEGEENTLALNCHLPHLLSPLLLIIPLQILAWRTACAKGIDLSVRIFDDFDRVLKSKI
ncbi:SIS domain-containing protein [Leclercia adecarboxylata]|uniref:SIS domain-containing protein n=1 Tax=Leclercia adecarboxylata TaxID=83655 RepID=UPI0022E1D5D9|nr:SIS domain-containing protein [Leclercia adecarboxylata]MDH6160855.1 glucoselysine-6-phosphate deglycase [Leclercia adecarboxylata]MDU1088617.1 SIS domain-containing protein [Leclercia adecarboxylata]MDU1651888.1 SIS domain-containing protein [Leclercia adecarboxylata]MDU6819570.1 SIS domain-containing protein [Leclercia adecarboxylata]WJT04475.1 SIS domain-containing protein [Leclercia adecarboxylata]